MAAEKRNCPRDFDENWLTGTTSCLVSEDDAEIKCSVYAEYVKTYSREKRRDMLLKCLSCLDLTTLSGDDTPEVVERLCRKAAEPLRPEALKRWNIPEDSIKCASVCVYPARVLDAKKCLDEMGPLGDGISIASVAGGFPSGQFKLVTRLEEIRLAIVDGAKEIDTVINRCAALQGKWRVVYDEVREMREICGDKAHLKTILATGELKSISNIYKASMAAMMAGSDFIKTSTGKEAVNATLGTSLVMCRAIKTFYDKTGIKVGFKPAGGIRSADVALTYVHLIQQELGSEWLTPRLFRIGASSLVDDIDKYLVHL